ncbi:MAG: hypothetical protein AB1847_14575 [bacterium]
MQIGFLDVKEGKIIVYPCLAWLRDDFAEPLYGLLEIPLLILLESLGIGTVFTKKWKFFDDLVHRLNIEYPPKKVKKGDFLFICYEKEMPGPPYEKSPALRFRQGQGSPWVLPKGGLTLWWSKGFIVRTSFTGLPPAPIPWPG